MFDKKKEDVRKDARMHVLRNGVTTIAAWYRGYRTRRRIAALKRGVVAVQCAWRRKAAQAEARRLRERSVQAVDWDEQERLITSRIQSKLEAMRQL